MELSHFLTEKVTSIRASMQASCIEGGNSPNFLIFFSEKVKIK